MHRLRRFVGILFSLIAIPFKVLLKRKQYKIKKGYIHRRKYKYYDNTPLTEEYQTEVYLEAARIMEENNFSSVFDFGCGSAYKLIQHLAQYDTIGLDVPETIEFLEKNYPDRLWVSTEDFHPETINADVLICADVVEHILYPLDIISQIKQMKDLKYIIFSTPERNIINGFLHYGPPGNPHHIREWSGWEFKVFLQDHFNIISHSITNYEQGTQMVICSNK